MSKFYQLQDVNGTCHPPRDLHPAIAVLVVSAAIDANPNTGLSVTTAEAVDSRLCVATFNTTSSIAAYAFIPRFILSILLCILAVTQFVRESLEMYKVKVFKQWRSNRYMDLLVREPILYNELEDKSEISPTGNLLHNAVCLVAVLAMPAYLVVTVGATACPYVVELAPRFVLSVRVLHSCVVGDHIDTGLGTGSPPTNNNTILIPNHGVMLAVDVETAMGRGTWKA
ncbi:hypothetical protein BU15DRAFT_68054 [Melanogaster broomeanus]|nr:hypothetical protein BU15DRAFT_68054 [Melanogaster broomeanus]